MPRAWIDDLDDERIAVYRHLKATNATRDRREFVVEGEKLVRRLMASRYGLASVLVTDRDEARIAADVPDGVPLYVVPRSAIDLLVGFNFHQGILASGFRREMETLDHVLSGLGDAATVVVCPALNNPENLGALARIADVFGADALLVGPRCPDPLSRRVLRVSMGASLRLPVLASADLRRDLQSLADVHDFELVATVAEPGAEPLDRAARPRRLALLLGSEPHGLGPEWEGLCTHRVTIPMRPGADSLNVAVAAGIMLYHFRRIGEG